MKKQLKVILQYLSLPNYRRSLFSELSKDTKINFEIVCGKSSPYPFLKNYSPHKNTNVTYIRNKYFRVGKTTFTWQKHILKTIINRKPNCVIMLGVDPTIISNFPLFIYLKLMHVKILWWSHGTLGHQGILGKMFRIFFYRLSDGVLLYNEDGKQRLINYNIDKHKLFVVGNCINHESYEDPSANLLRKKIKIIFSGRLEHRKKLEILFQAIKLFKERKIPVKLDIIGAGPSQDTLKTLVNTNNLEKEITFHGAIYGKAADRLISSANVGVIPGLAGLSTIHYMARGLPVVTNNNFTEHGPEVSAIHNGENGYIFEDGNYYDLVEKILLTIKNLEVLSKDAFFTVKKYYSPEFVKENIVRLIIQVNKSYG